MRHHFIKKPATSKKCTGPKKQYSMSKVSKKGNPYKFTNAEYISLKKHLVEIYMLGFNSWPEDKELWPKPKNAPGYIVTLFDQSNGRPFLIIKFLKPVETPAGKIGSHFRIGGTPHYYNPLF